MLRSLFGIQLFAGVLVVVALAALGLAVLPGSADVPDPTTSSCAVVINQAPLVPRCVNNFEPDVVRLSPAAAAVPPHDTATFNVVARDVNGDPIEGALVSLFESGNLNIANGGATTALTASDGSASIAVSAASGYGRASVCVAGVDLCQVLIRTPDINRSAQPTVMCLVGTGASSVAGADITNPMCGFLVNFGSTTSGVNDHCDLDCSGAVNGFDINGPSGVIQYFGDTGTLGPFNTCP